ncbi:MAG: winged helix-turn-helix domain-containing protein [Caldilinea sp.]|nr:winged helix-turn-helix domain-containing protein [Caldilinea sp.]HRA68810.1 winged helix-turn-helix domain-containing protein [Caldilinea sp.]
MLEILVKQGGSSDANVVLDLLYAKMAPVLNDYDHTPLASDGITPRWRNTAQWARNSLREQGLIRPDSPRGVWIISEAGRAWLRQG